jgi:hypothetical protein
MRTLMQHLNDILQLTIHLMAIAVIFAVMAGVS